MAQTDQLREFRAGLYRILLSGDVGAFGRYLRRWEDLIGDTAELAETSEAQQRRTMDALLRRPQQFNLPPWPREAPPQPLVALALPENPPSGVTPEIEVASGTSVAAASEDGLLPPAEEAWGGGSPPDSASIVPEATDGAPADAVPNAPPDVAASRRAYQLDMLTGELVRVEADRLSTAGHGTAGAEPSIVESAKPRRTRRRRVPPGMTQLAMWADGELSA
jgi:hypothetical protein